MNNYSKNDFEENYKQNEILNNPGRIDLTPNADGTPFLINMNNYSKNDFEENYKQPETLNNPSVGRIDLTANENGTPFFVQDKIEKNEKTNYSNAMQGLSEKSLLSITFFSSNNIENIQNRLRSQIYELTEEKYKIDIQDRDQLKIIMRSVFLQYSLYHNDNIEGQVNYLNKIVLNYAVPQVYGELMSYIKYKEDISSPPSLIELPEFSTNDKTIELKPFFEKSPPHHSLIELPDPLTMMPTTQPFT
jgi:hypothetical protein